MTGGSCNKLFADGLCPRKTSQPSAAGDINDRPVRIRSVPTGHDLAEQLFFLMRGLVSKGLELFT